MLASQVDDAEDAVFRDDLRVIARDARIRDDQVFIDFSSHAERTVIEVDDALLVPLDKHKRGKHA
jgi:hypothetical protein